MVRTQIQLSEEQSRLLKDVAASEGVSMAEVVRRSIDRYVRTRLEPSTAERRRAALSIIGKYASEPNDVSLTHDEHLAEIYAEVGD